MDKNITLTGALDTVKLMAQPSWLSEVLLETEEMTLQQRLAVLQDEHKRLLPIEADRALQIRDEVAEIHIVEARLRQQHQFLDKACSLGYDAWLPLDPLLWRDPETDFPRLALFWPGCDTVTFSVEWRWPFLDDQPTHTDIQLTPSLPHALAWAYRNLNTVVGQPRYTPHVEYQDAVTVNFTAKFSGTIPQGTRTKIRAAADSGIFTVSSDWGDVGLQPRTPSIYLITEVQTWEMNIVNPIYIDPIVVGWNAFYPDRLWYIDSFDITPLENRIPLITG